MATASVSPQPAPVSHLRITPHGIQRAIAVCVIGLFFWYVGGEVTALLPAPLLELSIPTNDVVTDARTISVAGMTESSASVVVNDTTVTNAEGAFRAEVELNPGVNTIVIRAFRRHGREATLERRVVRTIEQSVSVQEMHHSP